MMSENSTPKYDQNIDLNTEGYISQLIDAIGRKKVASITPHVFTYRIKKPNGGVPVITSSYNPKNSLFFGQLIVTCKAFTGLADVYIKLGSETLISLPYSIATFDVQNVLFDAIQDTNNLASVNTDVYDLMITFTGYKCTVA